MKPLSSKVYFIICLFIMILYLSPYYVIGEDMILRMTDNLVGEITRIKVAIDSGEFFSFDGKIPNMMNGVTRISYLTDINAYNLLSFLGVFKAYTLSKVIAVFWGFFGTLFLLREYILKDMKDNDFVVYGLSLGYAIMPWFPIFGMPFAAMPFALYAFLNIREGKIIIVSYLLIFLTVLLGDYIRIYMFFCMILAVILIYDFVKFKKINRKFLIAIIVFNLAFFIVEYRLIYFVLFKPFVSHRTEVDFSKSMASWDYILAIKYGIKDFIFGRGYHVLTFSFLPLIVAGITTVLKFKNSHKKGYLYLMILSVMFVFSVHFGLVERATIPEGAFGLKFRFFWINPILMLLATAFIFKELNSVMSKKIFNTIFALFIIAQLSQEVMASESNQFNKTGITFKEYYSKDLYKEIDEFISQDKSSYKILNIGIYPSIAHYNGFYTLDGYLNNYPLKYKHEFREIIEKELDKNEMIRNQFDYFGATCYSVSSEIPYRPYLYMFSTDHIRNINTDLKIKNLEFNMLKAKEMGARYVLSALEIQNYRDNNLKFEKIFSNNSSPYHIYLYKIL